MAVDNAGGGAEEGCGAGQGGFHRLGLGLRQKGEVGHAIGGGAGLDGGEFAGLLLAGGDYQLGAILMRQAALTAVIIEHLFAGDAVLRHQAAGRVIDPGMDHLGIA